MISVIFCFVLQDAVAAHLELTGLFSVCLSGLEHVGVFCMLRPFNCEGPPLDTLAPPLGSTWPRPLTSLSPTSAAEKHDYII